MNLVPLNPLRVGRRGGRVGAGRLVALGGVAFVGGGRRVAVDGVALVGAGAVPLTDLSLALASAAWALTGRGLAFLVANAALADLAAALTGPPLADFNPALVFETCVGNLALEAAPLRRVANACFLVALGAAFNALETFPTCPLVDVGPLFNAALSFCCALTGCARRLVGVDFFAMLPRNDFSCLRTGMIYLLC